MQVSEPHRSFRLSLPPWTLLAGVVLSFVTLCLLGREVSRENHLSHFARFTQWTSPETKYYPTVGEMMSHVRMRMKPGQILVMVGGNSILRGVGQPAGSIWTQALQDRLGAGYCVINFAFDSSNITDGAAVVAEALRNEFPRQIYIANAAPAQPPPPDGSGTYRFMFWEARSKGLLVDDPARNAAIIASNQNPLIRNPPPGGGDSLLELRAREWLDRWFYFQDFWNLVTYKWVNTVWGFYMPGPTQFLQPRRTYADPEPDRLKYSIDDRYIPANLAAELVNVRGCSEFTYGIVDATGFHEQKDATGHWVLYAPLWDQFNAGIKGIMPEELKKRTLILLSRSSPFYVRMLTPDEQERDNLAYLHAVDMWKAGGYESMDYGRDYTIGDYGDRTHLTSSGGAKLATSVAAKVREMSRSLGYLTP
ncbi:MAG TPA: hypothetical protein VG838_03155 [Opitutaceae bacterium]|nr:hypothetical protein [Opitutaceae bacterium]